MLASTAGGFLIFSGIFVVLFIWSYAYLYNHDLIRTYSGKRLIPVHSINACIKTELNHTFGLNLPEVNVGSEHLQQQDIVSETSTLGDSIIALVFSTSVASGILLMVLMMCEVADYGNQAARWTFFRYTIDTLIALLAFIQPFLIISLITTDGLWPDPQKYFRLIFFALIAVLWIIILKKCGLVSGPLQQLIGENDKKSVIERTTSEIAMVGITVLAMLSGLGCASTPYKVFMLSRPWNKSPEPSRPGSSKKKVSALQIADLIQSYNNIAHLLLMREQSLENLRGGSHEGMNPRSKLPGILSRVPSLANLRDMAIGGNQSESESLAIEIDLLKLLKGQVYDDLVTTINKFTHQERRTHNTIFGRKTFAHIILQAQAVFAAYCVYRIINVVLIRIPSRWMRGNISDEDIITSVQVVAGSDNMLLAQSPVADADSKDALATTIAKLIKSVGKLPVLEALLVNVLSFALSGGLFMCTISNVLFTFKSFARFFPVSTSISCNKNRLKHLFVSELVGVYTLATALLIRTNLPSTLSHQVSKVLSLSGTLSPTLITSVREVEYINRWFDKVFAIASVCTVLLLFAKQYIDDDMDGIDGYDEELFLESDDLFKKA